MLLCNFCRGFSSTIGREYIGDYYLHQPTFAALQESSTSCELCRLITNEFERTELVPSVLEEAKNGYPSAITFIGMDRNGPWKMYPDYQDKNTWTGLVGLRVGCGDQDRNDDWGIDLGLYTDHDDLASILGHIAGLRVPDNSGSEGSIDLIIRWINDCTANHLECLPSSSCEHSEEEALRSTWMPPLPTRVIDVGLPDGSQNPFLWKTSGRSGDYISLSHVWGKTKPFTTATATLSERQTGFTMEMLPKTFQDAVISTRAVGIRYIWIDSLCIIQDSKEDWSHESALMADIYANSLFTIAATSSPDSETGFLGPREPRPPVRMTYNPSDTGDTAHIYIQPDTLSFIDPLRRTPLNSRAWTLQERILSRRILHFGPTQLFWDCQHSFLSEDNVYAKRTVSATNNPLRQSLRQLDFHGPDLQYSHPAFAWPASILGRWMDLVHEYTRRQITVDTDALPALAGIVSRVAARTGDEFLAGIWRSTIHIELLWLAFNAPHKSAGAYRAPSWSWANLIGESHRRISSANRRTSITRIGKLWCPV